MADTTLRLTFAGLSDKNVVFNFPHANAEASAAQVKSLMQIIVTNGEIYSEEPLSLSSAEFRTVSVVPINIA